MFTYVLKEDLIMNYLLLLFTNHLIETNLGMMSANFQIKNTKQFMW